MALYSLCDGCDIQSERAASDEELFARRHQLHRIVKALLEQAEQVVIGGAGPEAVRAILGQFVDHGAEILAYC